MPRAIFFQTFFTFVSHIMEDISKLELQEQVRKLIKLRAQVKKALK